MKKSCPLALGKTNTEVKPLVGENNQQAASGTGADRVKKVRERLNDPLYPLAPAEGRGQSVPPPVLSKEYRGLFSFLPTFLGAESKNVQRGMDFISLQSHPGFVRVQRLLNFHHSCH